MRKTHLLLLLIIMPVSSLFGEINLNSNLLDWDDYHVDNDFLNSKDPKYILLNGPYNYYFRKLNNIDVAFSKEDPDKYWGVAAESTWDIVYYFNSSKKNKKFGYDYNTGKSYIKKIGQAVALSNGKIFASDVYDSRVYYWMADDESFDPTGEIDFKFGHIANMCKDNSDNLYILDDEEFILYKQSDSLKDVINLNNFYNNEWGYPSAVEVNDSGIFITFKGGMILKYNLNYEIESYYWIDTGNLGLASSNRELRSETWLVSITTDPEGNIYILDNKSHNIHVFSENLEYLFSWNDTISDRQITDDTNDITFYPQKYSFFIVYDWGFNTYRKESTLNVSLSNDFIYPKLINESYNGIELSMDLIGGNSYLDIYCKNSNESNSYYMVEDYPFYENTSYDFFWDGRDNNENILNDGEYTLEFYLNNNLAFEKTIEIKPPPQVNFITEEYKTYSDTNESIAYDINTTENIVVDGFINETKSPDSSQYFVSDEYMSQGQGSIKFSLNKIYDSENIPDNLYYLGLNCVPANLSTYKEISNYHYIPFYIDENEISIKSFELTENENGINPAVADQEIQAVYEINEDGYVSAFVLDSNNDVIKSIYTDRKIIGNSENSIFWDGKVNGYPSYEGDYHFKIAVKSLNGIGNSVVGDTSTFRIDTSPVVVYKTIKQIDLNNEIISENDFNNTYFISNNEDSSIGIKDDLNISLLSNENCEIELEIASQGKNISVVNDSLFANELYNYNWNGTDSSGEILPDGNYYLALKIIDMYGSEQTEVCEIIIDNNMSDDSSVISFAKTEKSSIFNVQDSLQKDDAENTVFNDLIPYEDGYIYVFQEYNGIDVSEPSIEDFNYNSNIYFKIYDKQFKCKIDKTCVSNNQPINKSLSISSLNDHPVQLSDEGFSIKWSDYHISSYDYNGKLKRLIDIRNYGFTALQICKYSGNRISFINNMSYEDNLPGGIQVGIQVGIGGSRFSGFKFTIINLFSGNKKEKTISEGYEPPRVFRRHNYMRGLCYGKTNQVC